MKKCNSSAFNGSKLSLKRLCLCSSEPHRQSLFTKHVLTEIHASVHMDNLSGDIT